MIVSVEKYRAIKKELDRMASKNLINRVLLKEYYSSTHYMLKVKDGSRSTIVLSHTTLENYNIDGRTINIYTSDAKIGRATFEDLFEKLPRDLQKEFLYSMDLWRSL